VDNIGLQFATILAKEDKYTMFPFSIWIENTMSGAKRKCSNDQITSAQPTSPSVSSPTLHPHPSLEARARPCSVEAQQLVSHDVDAKLRPPIIQLINGSLQPYIAKMGNMEPQHIARLVSSDVSAKLKPLIDGLAIQCVESYMNLGANSSVWAPNPSMDNARIVSELVQLPGGELLVLITSAKPYFQTIV
jgi:hypothetical protein